MELLARGATGDAVKSLQENLAALGYYDAEIVDLYGPYTEAAVCQLQYDHGLPMTGVTDDATARALQGELLRKSEQVGTKEGVVTITAYGPGVTGPPPGMYGVPVTVAAPTPEFYGAELAPGVAVSRIGAIPEKPPTPTVGAFGVAMPRVELGPMGVPVTAAAAPAAAPAIPMAAAPPAVPAAAVPAKKPIPSWVIWAGLGVLAFVLLGKKRPTWG